MHNYKNLASILQKIDILLNLLSLKYKIKKHLKHKSLGCFCFKACFPNFQQPLLCGHNQVFDSLKAVL